MRPDSQPPTGQSIDVDVSGNDEPEEPDFREPTEQIFTVEFQVYLAHLQQAVGGERPTPDSGGEPVTDPDPHGLLVDNETADDIMKGIKRPLEPSEFDQVD